jgi:hypothetical protein
MSEERGKKLRNLVSQLDVPTLDENDIKAMALAVIYDVEGDNTWAQKVKLEALRLLKDLVVKPETKKSKDLDNSDILGILNSNNKQKPERN